MSPLAVVTGANRGIGLEIVRQLAAREAPVAWAHGRAAGERGVKPDTKGRFRWRARARSIVVMESTINTFLVASRIEDDIRAAKAARQAKAARRTAPRASRARRRPRFSMVARGGSRQ
jgi:NAD(P)-dependent dehydrogenase (short-subunit alcohol dehydrogenase family)